MIRGIEHTDVKNQDPGKGKIVAWIRLEAEEVAVLPGGEETFEDIVSQSVDSVRGLCARGCGSCALDGWIRDDENDVLSVELECAKETCKPESADALVIAAHTLVNGALSYHGINSGHDAASEQSQHDIASTPLIAALRRAI